MEFFYIYKLVEAKRSGNIRKGNSRFPLQSVTARNKAIQHYFCTIAMPGFSLQSGLNGNGIAIKKSMKEEKNYWNKVNQWEEEIEILKSIISKTELVETTKWGGSIFTNNNKNILEIGGFKSYFGVWFLNGVFLKDEAQVLVNAQEGVTKALRQWRFQSKEEIKEKLLLQYIKEAIANEEKGLSHKPVKKELIICDFFKNELTQSTAFAEAFLLFSPFKQKEFLEYIATAKQEKTKATRMEKIKPMILQNIGLNDKYR